MNTTGSLREALDAWALENGWKVGDVNWAEHSVAGVGPYQLITSVSANITLTQTIKAEPPSPATLRAVIERGRDRE